MNKKEFIKQLRTSLRGLPKEEIKAIVTDYEDHFAAAKANKKDKRSEAAVAKALGDPKKIAKQHKAEAVVKKSESKKSVGNIFQAALAIAGLGFFNLVFVVGIFAGLLGALAGFFGAAIGIALGGLGGMLASFFVGSLPWISFGIPPLAGFFVSLGLAAFGIFFFIGDCYLAKWFYKLTVAYLKFNVKIVKGEKL